MADLWGSFLADVHVLGLPPPATMTKEQVELTLMGLPADGAFMGAVRLYRPWVLDRHWWKKLLDERIARRRNPGRRTLGLSDLGMIG